MVRFCEPELISAMEIIPLKVHTQAGSRIREKMKGSKWERERHRGEEEGSRQEAEQDEEGRKGRRKDGE